MLNLNLTPLSVSLRSSFFMERERKVVSSTWVIRTFCNSWGSCLIWSSTPAGRLLNAVLVGAKRVKTAAAIPMTQISLACCVAAVLCG